MLRFKEYNREQGFTLIELLIAMALALIIIGALSSAFVSQRKSYAVQEQVSDMIQGARAAMDMISREVKMAGFDPKRAGIVGIPYSATQLQIVADKKVEDGAIDATSEENIIYSYDSASFQIDRNIGSGNQPLAENIQGFTFTYWDENGTEITSSAQQVDIRVIKIEIETKTAEPDPIYTHPTYGDGYRRYKLTSYVTPPNLDL